MANDEAIRREFLKRLAGIAMAAAVSLAGDTSWEGPVMPEEPEIRVGADGHHRAPGHGHQHHPTPPTPTPPAPPTPTPPSTGPTPTPAPASGYTFADEFDGAAGTAPSSKNWSYDLGGGGWGNNELEVYTNEVKNAYQDGYSHLAIEVDQIANGTYNSARLVTRGIFTQMYGSFEAGIKLAPVEGLWPAFWLLGVNDASWPACGELDIMENYGSSLVSCTINNGTTGWLSNLEADTTDDGNWHVYRCDWAPGTVSMFKDGKLLQTQTPETVDGNWPYDNAAAMGGGLYFILNVAVGGTGVDGVSPSAGSLPAIPMLVDYVHAWENS
jgi:beta-glucanase (GH16 family)